MTEAREHPILKHIVWPAISLVVLGLLTAIGVWMFGSWQGFFARLNDIYAFMIAEISVPRISYWIPLGVSLLICVCGLLLICSGRLRRRFPRWRAYNQDYFFDVFWRWNYPFNLDKLAFFCPKCDAQLFQKQRDDKTILWCPVCSSSYGPYGENEELSYQGILQCVQRHIDLIIRRGDWRQHLGVLPMRDALPAPKQSVKGESKPEERKRQKLVRFKCLGCNVKDTLRWLSVNNGEVALVADENARNTSWVIETLPDGQLAIRNHDISDVQCWLYGRTRMKDGNVRLCDKAQVDSGTGGKWKIHAVEGKQGIMRIECQGENRERIWLDGITKQGQLQLVPEDKITNSGTSWEMITVREVEAST